MNSHPNFTCIEEILNETYIDIPKQCREHIETQLHYRVDGASLSYQDRLFLTTPQYIQHVLSIVDGFKFLDYHIAPYPSAIRYLQERNDIVILRLRRRNLFHSYVSHLLVLRSGLWVKEKDSQHTDESPIYIEPLLSKIATD